MEKIVGIGEYSVHKSTPEESASESEQLSSQAEMLKQMVNN
jgi:hypothetical protein